MQITPTALSLGLAPFRKAAGAAEGRLIDFWRVAPDDLPGACTRLVNLHDACFKEYSSWQSGIEEVSLFLGTVVVDLTTRGGEEGLSQRRTTHLVNGWSRIIKGLLEVFFNIADTHVEQRPQAIDLYLPIMLGTCGLSKEALEAILKMTRPWERGVANLVLLPSKEDSDIEFREVRVAHIYQTGEGSHSQRIYKFEPEGARVLDASDSALELLNAEAAEHMGRLWAHERLDAPNVRPFLRFVLRPNGCLEVWIGNQTIVEHFEGQWRVTLPEVQADLLRASVDPTRLPVDRGSIATLFDLARALGTHNHGAILALADKRYKPQQKRLPVEVRRLPASAREALNQDEAAVKAFGEDRFLPFRSGSTALGRLIYTLCIADGACIVNHLNDQLFLREYGQVIRSDTKRADESPGSRRVAARTLSKNARVSFVLCVSQDGPIRIFLDGDDWGRLR